MSCVLCFLRTGFRLAFGAAADRRAWLPAVALPVLLLVGCGQGDKDGASAVPPASATSSGPAVDPVALQIDKLIAHSNPVVANNAKQLKTSLEGNDFSQAAYSITSIASIRLPGELESVVSATLDKLREAATAAADKGDANAKFALAHLKDTFGE